MRLRHAESHLAAAKLVSDLGRDAGVDMVPNVVGSLAALAGIAAVDAICGFALGVRSASSAHADASALLARVSNAADVVTTFGRLEQFKSASQYSSAVFAAGRGEDMLIWASRLVDRAREFETK